MQLSCIHCGNAFTITKQQLGGRGNCPHCGGAIRLPKADDAAEARVFHRDDLPETIAFDHRAILDDYFSGRY